MNIVASGGRVEARILSKCDVVVPHCAVVQRLVAADGVVAPGAVVQEGSSATRETLHNLLSQSVDWLNRAR
jgi:hypothetical protein